MLERAVRSAGKGLAVAWPMLLLASVGACDLEAQERLDGAYGLWVTDEGGEVVAHWLTSGADRGFLEVYAGDRQVFAGETPASGAHSARFSRPNEDVVLRFGGREDDSPAEIELFLGEDAPPEDGVLTGIDSVFVVGDIHGEFERLSELLRNGGLVDSAGRWIGGRRHIVFLGDVFDRGPDVTRTLWFLYGLEREAREAGGGAHVVLGNHETMIFTGDLRYVSPKEQLVALRHGVPYTELFDIRRSVLGKWLADRPAVMRIDGILLTHGGIAGAARPRDVVALNDSIRAFLGEDLFYRWADTTVALVSDSTVAETVRGEYSQVIVMDSASVQRRTGLVFAEDGPLWFRGYVEGDEGDERSAELSQVLEAFGAGLHVVGHTPVPTIESRYGGDLIAVDLLEPASEMLLLVRDPRSGAYGRFRIRTGGPPEPL